jgi:hypothetical protein
MRKLSLIVIIMVAANSMQLLAQVDSLSNKNATDKTQYLFSTKKLKLNTIGLYFAPEGGIGSLNSSSAPVAGGSFMLLLNKKIAIGVGGFGTGFQGSKAKPLNLEYGGLKFEYTPKPNAKVHITFPLIIGGGMARNDTNSNHYGSNNYTGNKGFNRKNGNYRGGGDRGFNGSEFVIIQPGINLEANLIRYVKIFGGVNYRFASKVANNRNGVATTSDTIPAKQVSGITAIIGLKFGLFDYNFHKRDSVNRYHKKQYKRK